jgi:hypothetical protein
LLASRLRRRRLRKADDFKSRLDFPWWPGRGGLQLQVANVGIRSPWLTHDKLSKFPYGRILSGAGGGAINVNGP